jgi:hypothetical protein
MPKVLASIALDRVVKSAAINWCMLFSAKHASLRSMRKDWLTRNQNTVSNGATCLR